MLLTPVQAPNANAYADRWVHTIRAEYLDWLLILGRGHLEHVPRGDAAHNNAHRPHRALGLEPPDPPADLIVVHDGQPAGGIDATYSADSSTNTLDELHERIYAPYGHQLGR